MHTQVASFYCRRVGPTSSLVKQVQRVCVTCVHNIEILLTQPRALLCITIASRVHRLKQAWKSAPNHIRHTELVLALQCIAFSLVALQQFQHKHLSIIHECCGLVIFTFQLDSQFTNRMPWEYATLS